MRFWRSGFLVVAVVALVVLTFGPFGHSAGASTRASLAVDAPGYWLAGADGGVFAFNAPFYGSANPQPQCAPSPPRLAPSACASAIGAPPDGGGYTVVDPASYSPLGTGTLSPNSETLPVPQIASPTSVGWERDQT